MTVNKSDVEFEKWKTRIVEEMFIETADEDYVLARWLFQNQLYRQYYWNAAQTVEKLLKASLLVNNHSVQEESHDLEKLYKRVASMAGDLLPTELHVPAEVTVPIEVTSAQNPEKTAVFVARLNKNGRASNRYNIFSTLCEFTELYKLDEIVFSLRNITHPLDQREYFNGTDASARDLISQDSSRNLREFNTRLSNPAFASAPVITGAYDNNYRLAPKNYAHSEPFLVSGGSSTWLSFLAKNPTATNHSVRAWLIENVKLSDREKKELKLKP
jgi:hypothetical protein